jgi:hypothetical protein
VKTNVALYVDGFNLYHAIADLSEPHLKWVNLRSLGELIIPSATEELVRIVFCTAFYPGDSHKRWRHEQYLHALRVVRVDPIQGHYVREDRECFNCGASWKKPTEKETDINLALSLFNDARIGVFETAYLLTADSDQAATARMFSECFPEKRLISVSPPGRGHSVHILKYASAKIALNKEHVERCLFPSIVFAEGMPAGRRPREYEPPNGWSAPK